MIRIKQYSLWPAILLLGFIFAFSSPVLSQNSESKTDRELIRDAVEDYLLGLYEADPSRIERSVDSTLRKIGYYEYEGKTYDHVPMTYQQLYDLSARWNKDGSKVDDKSPRVIDIYAVHDKTASAKLTAVWGIDFMHLSKTKGKWKIMNIIWQRAPKEK